MALPKDLLSQLQRFATAFREARDREANESDTVMYLVKFFEDVLGYDSLKGEISKEHAIKDRFCDIALKAEGSVKVLVEVKAAGQKTLSDKHIEQAENYASRAGIRWVILTNGIDWRLYHLTFAESEGITHELAFETNLLAGLETDPEGLWVNLGLLARDTITKSDLDDFWEHKKALSAASVVRVLLHENVLNSIRRELNRNAPARLDLEDVFKAVRDVLSKEALADAGDLSFRKKRKRRRKVQRTDAATGTVVTEEVEEDVPEGGEASGAVESSASALDVSDQLAQNLTVKA
jgi:predicted type IV restriction endonuclease